jgi:hypothetical protein
MILSNDLIPTKNLLVSRWLNVEHPRFRVMYHTVRIFVSELSGACVRCSCAGALLCPSWRGHVFLPYPFISSTVLRIHLSRFIFGHRIPPLLLLRRVHSSWLLFIKDKILSRDFGRTCPFAGLTAALRFDSLLETLMFRLLAGYSFQQLWLPCYVEGGFQSLL